MKTTTDFKFKPAIGKTWHFVGRSGEVSFYFNIDPEQVKSIIEIVNNNDINYAAQFSNGECYISTTADLTPGIIEVEPIETADMESEEWQMLNDYETKLQTNGTQWQMLLEFEGVSNTIVIKSEWTDFEK